MDLDNAGYRLKESIKILLEINKSLDLKSLAKDANLNYNSLHYFINRSNQNEMMHCDALKLSNALHDNIRNAYNNLDKVTKLLPDFNNNGN